MKKIAAFITAFLLFIATISFMTISDRHEVAMNNPRIGLWVNEYKDKSMTAVSQNLGDDMALLLGSSEFHYGKKTKYHPSKVFAKSDKEFMIIGASYTQSLFHAILVGAVSPELKRKEATLLVSPSWFKEKGIEPGAFAMRFSETEYLAFLKNPQISSDVKKEVAALVEERLSSFLEMQDKVKLYNKVYAYGTATPAERIVVSAQEMWADKTDYIAFKNVLGLTSFKKYKKWVRPRHKHGQTPLGATKRWKGVKISAEREAALRAGDNPFYMSQKLYKLKVEPRLEYKKNSSIKDTYAKSPEYEYLKLFLKVCKETGVTPKIIMLPQNGYWYDYTGFPVKSRIVARDKVRNIAKENNVQFIDLYGESYEKYFFKDTVHPSAKGWIKIDEAINKSY